MKWITAFVLPFEISPWWFILIGSWSQRFPRYLSSTPLNYAAVSNTPRRLPVAVGFINIIHEWHISYRFIFFRIIAKLPVTMSLNILKDTFVHICTCAHPLILPLTSASPTVCNLELIQKLRCLVTRHYCSSKIGGWEGNSLSLACFMQPHAL